MTKTTTATTTTMVTTTASEFIAFVMDKTTGMTVARVEAELDALGVVYRKKDKKEVKAQLWFDALERQGAIAELQEEEAATPAADETSVAVQNYEEETTMTNKVTKAQMEQNFKVLADKYVKGSVDYTRQAEIYSNPAWTDVLDKVRRAFEQYVLNIGENGVLVERILFYRSEEELKSMSRSEAQALRRTNRVVRTNDYGSKFIGEAVIRLPKNYAVIAQWDKTLPNNKGGFGARTFVPFDGFDFDFVRDRFNIFTKPAKGNGLIVVSIREDKDGLPYVSLPVNAYTDKATGQTRFGEIFRTADTRFIKTKDAVEQDESLFLEDNNHAFNAQVTAFIRMRTNEHYIANPMNRHNFKERCDKMVVLQSRDGVMDDVLAESLKTRAMLDQIDVTQLAQAGEAQPTTFCLVTKRMLDEEAAEIINDARQFEPTSYTDENGKIRFQAHNEIMVGGKPKTVQEVREESINKICSECPFFCNNSPKEENRIAKERTQQREAGVKNPYVDAFYKERPRAERQAIQTLVVEKQGERAKWVTKAPGEVMGLVHDIVDMRVKGATLSVYGSDEVLAGLDVNFVPAVEEFDARHADVMKKVNYLYNGAFNLRKLTDEQAALIFDLADNKPDGMTEYEAKRWDAAIGALANALVRLEEQEAAADIPMFDQVFFEGAQPQREGLIELHVEQVMGEAMRRDAEGTFQYGEGYGDMTPDEFVRYLDENALDYVWDVIVEGKEFSIVGGGAIEKHLAAASLQSMLQAELTKNFYSFATGDYREASLLSGVRKEQDPAEVLADMNISERVKSYLALVLGL